MVVYKDRPDDTATSIYISPRVEEMFGYPRESWMQEGFFAGVVHPDDRDRILGEVGDGLEGTAQMASFEPYRVIAADGHAIWIRDAQWIVRDPDGTPLFQQG